MSLKRYNQNGSVAFDAASSSGMAFLNAQLEYANPKLVEPLTSMTHPRDITVEFGGGFVDYLTAYASDYGTTGGNQYGLQGTNNTDIAVVDTTINKGVWQAWNWAAAIVVTYIDLKKLEAAKSYGQTPPFSLDTMLNNGVKLVWNKAMEKVTYLGWLGQPGIINNTNVTSALAPATGTGGLRTWASKTPVQIQSDINSGISATLNQSAYSLDGMADTMLVSSTIYDILLQPMGTTSAFNTILEFVLNNNKAKQNGIDFKIFFVANPWITGQGAGTTERAVFYRNNPESLSLRAPQPINKAFTVPTTRSGGAYETIYNGCIGQVQWLRSMTAYYLDGIG